MAWLIILFLAWGPTKMPYVVPGPLAAAITGLGAPIIVRSVVA